MKGVLKILGAALMFAGLIGAVGLISAIVAGDRMLQPLCAKYGKLSDYEWYTNVEARAVFHGPGPMGENSWPIYFAAWLIPLFVGSLVAGAAGLSIGASSRVRVGLIVAVLAGGAAMGFTWVQFRESISAISSVVE